MQQCPVNGAVLSNVSPCEQRQIHLLIFCSNEMLCLTLVPSGRLFHPTKTASVALSPLSHTVVVEFKCLITRRLNAVFLVRHVSRGRFDAAQM